MKTIIATSMVLFSTFASLANASQGIICRDDRRMENGPLKELILTPADGGYLLQSQFIPSLHSPDLVVENWAENLSCKLDEKLELAFCSNPEGQVMVQVKERREVFYDSLEEDAKKKSSRYTDISVTKDGVEANAMSFAANLCQTFGSRA